MSFHRTCTEASSPILSSPQSPWRVRAEQIRRRPVRLRQAMLFLASLTLLCSIVYFSGRRQYDAYERWDQLEESYIPPAHEHKFTKAASQHARPPGIFDAQDVPVEAAADIPTTDDTHATSDAIVFSLIMFSEDSAHEGAVLIKSILMYTSKPVEFHVICDEGAKGYLEKRFRLITRPAQDILVRFYLLSLSAMHARIEREGAIVSDHSAGTPGLMKLFIHEILPNSVPRAIFIDTDAFFITDPALLWDRFATFASETAFAMPWHPDQDSDEWHNANRICSCIMLLDLARLRALRLMDSVAYRAAAAPALAPAAFNALYGPPGPRGTYEGVKLGDQGYWWAIVSHVPGVFEHLSYDWEMSSCLMDMYGTGLGDEAVGVDEEATRQVHTVHTPHEGEAVLPKMLHFNCLDGTPHYYEWEGWSDPQNSLTQRWLPAVQYHVGFKWLWLNAHQPLGALTIETVDEVVFADELFAQQQERAHEQST